MNLLKTIKKKNCGPLQMKLTDAYKNNKTTIPIKTRRIIIWMKEDPIGGEIQGWPRCVLHVHLAVE